MGETFIDFNSHLACNAGKTSGWYPTVNAYSRRDFQDVSLEELHNIYVLLV